MAETLGLDTRESGDWTVVEVSGEVDLYTAPRLKTLLTELTGSGRTRIAVEFSGVEFMDSTGLGVLISGLRRCREAGGTMALVAPAEPVRKVLGITGLDQVFAIHDDLSEVIGS
ncbi:MAG TPA: STAS domain-containing protein [Actinomycetota bacterium]|nr:STAS domain-containing protein [Actinomycetota bacterium]